MRTNFVRYDCMLFIDIIVIELVQMHLVNGFCILAQMCYGLNFLFVSMQKNYVTPGSRV